ncbi:MAG: rhodanese-like domain-containing protein [Candidatus Diapherotrites archaeon]|nr:rhodanese-like domain-containing protein [Candidatus Diapherotrites archaeon]
MALPFEMDAAEALSYVPDKEWVWIDVREKEEWDSGHLPQAQLISMSTITPSTFDAFPKSQKMILICRSGARSLRATLFLRERGYQQVYNFRGGLLAYNARMPQPIPLLH